MVFGVGNSGWNEGSGKGLGKLEIAEGFRSGFNGT